MLSRMASVKRRRAVQFPAVGLQGLGHLVEGAHQRGQLVDGAYASRGAARLPLRTSPAASSSAEIGTLICRARKSAIQVATNRMKSVSRDSSSR